MPAATIDLNLNVHVVRPETNGHARPVAAHLPIGDSEIVGVIRKTSDLSRFRPHPRQREFNAAGLRQLKESVDRHGFLWWNPVLVVEDKDGWLLTLDGGHRLEDARLRQKEDPFFSVTYLVIPPDQINMALVRSTPPARRWSLLEAETFYVQEGNQHYVRFRTFREEVGLNPSNLLTVCYKGNSQGRAKDPKTGERFGGGPIANFAEGRLTFTDEQECEARRVLNLAKRLSDLCPDQNFYQSPVFLQAIRSLVGEHHVSPDRLVDKAKEHFDLFSEAKCKSVGAWRALLAQMYNKRLPRGINRIHLLGH